MYVPVVVRRSSEVLVILKQYKPFKVHFLQLPFLSHTVFQRSLRLTLEHPILREDISFSTQLTSSLWALEKYTSAPSEDLRTLIPRHMNLASLLRVQFAELPQFLKLCGFERFYGQPLIYDLVV